jgi:hypothetical protein
MNSSIELPDEIADQIGNRWDDLPRRALEALVADAYREEVISGPRAEQMLGLGTRLELDAFLKRARIVDYTEDDLGSDIRTLDSVLDD